MTIIDTLKNTHGYLGLKPFAAMIGSHPRTVYGWVREGKLPHSRIRSRYRFDPSVVAAWLEKREAV